MIAEQGRLAGIAYGQGIGETLAASMNLSVGKGVEDAFIGIADSVGRAFAEGENPIAAFGERFMQTIGTVLQEIGKQIIIQSKLVEAIKTALKVTGPGAQTLPLGLALVAAGAAARAIKFNVPKLAAGGITSGPTLAMIGEAGREAVIPLDRLNDFIEPANAPVILNGNWEIAGEKLRFVLDQTQKKRARR